MAVEEWDTAFKAVLDWTAIKGRFIRSNGGVSNLRYPLFLSCFNSIKLEQKPPIWGKFLRFRVKSKLQQRLEDLLVSIPVKPAGRWRRKHIRLGHSPGASDWCWVGPFGRCWICVMDRWYWRGQNVTNILVSLCKSLWVCWFCSADFPRYEVLVCAR